MGYHRSSSCTGPLPKNQGYIDILDSEKDSLYLHKRITSFLDHINAIPLYVCLGYAPIPDTPQKKIQKTPSGDPKT